MLNYKTRHRLPFSALDVTVLLFLLLFTALNIGYWAAVRHIKPVWTNVPPPPSKLMASAPALGDFSFAYRLNGLMIQNFGDTGGRTTAIKDYDFNTLTQWFFLQDYLDPNSAHIPYLAAYYFSASQEPEKIRPIIKYLEEVGSRPTGENWRWLSHAVFLARFRMNDLELALSLAHKLAAIKNPDMPEWTRQMPAFIMNAKGEKEASYAMMLEILKTRADHLHPEEVTSMHYYICQSILTEAEAAKNPLCSTIK